MSQRRACWKNSCVGEISGCQACSPFLHAKTCSASGALKHRLNGDHTSYTNKWDTHWPKKQSGRWSLILELPGFLGHCNQLQEQWDRVFKF